MFQTRSWNRLGARCRVPVVLLVILCQPLAAAGQEEGAPFVDVVRSVVLDPTTYAPAVLSHHAAMRDWNTSQPLFRNGYLERNPRLTVSGLSMDIPLSYDEGRRLILRDTFTRVQVSAVHNLTSRSLERVLLNAHPQRRRLIRFLGWVERGAFASYMAWELSIHHHRQAQENERIAREHGLR